ncbi:hypothetical protein BDR04DRAFT_1123249 [Suillus decipiens]|nr:hypothetical protein BDR04DRAFT_1123249 [Suillus decipiens]
MSGHQENVPLEATDRLNEWGSMLGRKAIKILEHELRKAEYKTDITARVQYIQALLPHKIDGHKRVPFIYLNPENLKGLWLGPMLLELLATHAKRCSTSFQAFGKPTDALGVCAAATASQPKKQRRTPSVLVSLPYLPKNVAFDAAWGSLANQYTSQTVKLPEKTWDQVLDGMWELVGDNSLWSRGPMTDGGDDDSMDIRDAIPMKMSAFVCKVPASDLVAVCEAPGHNLVPGSNLEGWKAGSRTSRPSRFIRTFAEETRGNRGKRYQGCAGLGDTRKNRARSD